MTARSMDNGNCTFSRWQTIPEVVIGRNSNDKVGIFDHSELGKNVAKWLRRRTAQNGKIGAQNVDIAVSDGR